MSYRHALSARIVAIFVATLGGTTTFAIEPDYPVNGWVLVEVPLAGQMQNGEVRDVSDVGYAVGRMWTATQTHPFLYYGEATGDVSILLPLGTGGLSGVAHGLNNLDPPTVVGEVTRADGTHPVVWTENAGTWSVNDLPGLTTGDDTGVANDVNDTGDIVGFVQANTAGTHVAALWDSNRNLVGSLAPTLCVGIASGNMLLTSEALGINDAGDIVGWRLDPNVSCTRRLAMAWDGGSQTVEVHPTQAHHSIAFAINSSQEIVGWHSANGINLSPTIWTPDGGGPPPTWTPINVSPLPGVIGTPTLAAVDINEHQEAPINRHWPASGDTVGPFIAKLAPTPPHLGEDLHSMMRLPRAPSPDETGAKEDWELYEAFAISNPGWFGVSYVKEYVDSATASNTAILPGLLLPTNWNYNDQPGESYPLPDYREIVEETADDDDGNGIPDDIEWTHPGLQAPGTDANGKTLDIGNTRCARWLVQNTDYDLLLGDCGLSQFIYNWGQGKDSQGTDGPNRETILTLRFPAPGQESFDGVPDQSDEEDRDEILASVEEFVAAFTPCIDFVQIGNESFGGAAEYIVWENGSPVKLTQANNPEAALIQLFDWFDLVSQAARNGAGRKGYALRVISPGVTIGFVRSAAPGDSAGTLGSLVNRQAYTMRENLRWSRRTGDIADLHLHFSNLDHVSSASNDGAIDYLTTNLLPSNGWNPGKLTVLEWGMDPSGTDETSDPGWWWEFELGRFVNREALDEFYLNEDTKTHCEWEDFIEGWIEDEINDYSANLSDGTPAQITIDSLDMIASAEVSGVGVFVHACYGPSVQKGTPGGGTNYSNHNRFDLAAARSNQTAQVRVCENTDLDPVWWRAFEGAAALILAANDWIDEPHSGESNCNGCP